MAAVVLGGTSLADGVGTVVGTVLGALHIGARKPNGFVHVRKSTDAARSLIQELQENEQFGEDRGDEVIDPAVRKFPAIAHVGS
ncbi:hypothetical protein N8E89_21210 (plasmid) [Phyllobacterium sp. A18/5-2]|uniref:hypothetical protein n=1 Tax=Phyllobacterium sp. A18/5-2 TaxID=2978392 RepID=UPI0021C6FD47|nr:hypothetical protein [Phyllobacterium sp. A18/5-2]UXN67051.1 hypothetical protein N8E89_21210 [Phyllobacterium sp. A18/5-2]